MKLVAYGIGISALLSAVAPTLADAQSSEPFVAIPVTYQLPSTYRHGVRNVSMGTVGAACSNGLSSAHYNPSSLVWMDAAVVSGDHYSVEFLGTQEFRFVSVGVPLRRTHKPWVDGFRYGVSFAYGDHRFEDYTERTIFVPQGFLTDGTDYFVTGTMGVGLKTGAFEIAIGASARQNKTKVRMDIDATSFDVGTALVYDRRTRGGQHYRVRIGLSALELGKDIPVGSRSLPPPSEIRTGVGFDFAAGPMAESSGAITKGRALVGVSVDVDYISPNETRIRQSEDGLAAGIELSILEMLHVRTGQSDNVWSNDVYESFGVGVGWDSGRWLAQFNWARIDGDDCVLWCDTDMYGVTVGARW